jgi:hypothetical protein
LTANSKHAPHGTPHQILVENETVGRSGLEFLSPKRTTEKEVLIIWFFVLFLRLDIMLEKKWCDCLKKNLNTKK